MSVRTAAIVVTLALGIILAPLAADAQQPAKAYRIGFLGSTMPTDPRSVKLLGAFRQGLHDHGWVEGQNIAIEYVWAEGRAERFPALAADLDRLQVDVIVTRAGEPGALAAKKATSTIPIVMAVAADPVGTGLVASLGRPGGNITGLIILAAEVGGKRLELLKEAVPKGSPKHSVYN